MLKGTDIGVVSDINGRYDVNVPDRMLLWCFLTLVILPKGSCWGSARNQRYFSEDLIGLDEVVVIGYGSIRTADVTSAVVSVKPESYTQGSVRDLGQLIQGKVAGLIINTTSGNPSGNSSIRLRGNTTLHGTSTNPLILIDGVPGDFNTVSPDDIESIDVLKDGSAAAIYGTRGTNGVLLLQPKGQTRIYEIMWNTPITLEPKPSERKQIYWMPMIIEDSSQKVSLGRHMIMEGTPTGWMRFQGHRSYNTII